MKAVHLVKAVVTRWLSYGAACKRYLEILDQELVAKPNPDISRYQLDLLEPRTVLKLSLLSYQSCVCCYDQIAKISGQYMMLGSKP